MQHLRCSPTCHKPHKQLPYNLQKHNTNTWQNTLLACTVTECNCTDSVHCNWWSPWRPLHWLITGKAICNSGLAFWQAGASRQNLSASVGFAFWPATGALPLDLSGGLLSPHPPGPTFHFLRATPPVTGRKQQIEVNHYFYGTRLCRTEMMMTVFSLLATHDNGNFCLLFLVSSVSAGEGGGANTVCTSHCDAAGADDVDATGSEVAVVPCVSLSVHSLQDVVM